MGKGGRKGVQVYEYSEPTDFEDEEIDEDEAFAPEDYKLYGDVGRKHSAGDEDEDEEADFASLEDIIEYGSDEDDSDADEAASADDDAESEEDDAVEDDQAHSRFLEQIAEGLTGKPVRKRNKQERAEHGEESEFNVHGGEGVDMEDLLGSLDDTSEYGDLKKKLEKLQQRQAPLSKPLSAPVKTRLSRKVAYEKLSKDVSKWQHTVAMNRRAESVSFLEPKVPTVTNKVLAAKFKPQTDLEKEVADVLRTSGIEEKKITQYEELAVNELTEEEVKERTAQLAKMRSLMFYNEQKLKHKKKIKSRKYRKILKRAKQKHELTLEELASVDPEKYQEELEKREMERMRERLTLKHTSKTGQWSRRTAKMKDAGSKLAIQQQLQRGAELRKKMENLHGSDSDSDASSDDEGNEDNGFLSFGDDEEEEQAPATGIHALKFMQRAVEKQRKDYEESLRDDADESDEEDGSGRMQFGNRDDFAKPSSRTPSAASGAQQQQQQQQQQSGRMNGAGRPGVSQAPQSEEDKAAAAANPWVKKSKVAKGGKGAGAELDVGDILEVAESSTAGGNANLLSSQKSVVAQAFAGMDVVKEFAKEKQRIVEEDEPKEKTELKAPGWGSWAGEGVALPRKRKARPEKEQKPRKKRADDGLAHVIINERKDKKALKYTVASVPYPFTSKEQYEASIRQPLGPEWNTRSSHKSMTKPQIVKKSGAVILPIARPIAKKKKHSSKSRRSRVPKNLAK